MSFWGIAATLGAIGGIAWAAMLAVKRKQERNAEPPVPLSEADGKVLRLVDSIEAETRELIPLITAGSLTGPLKPIGESLLAQCHAGHESTKSWHLKEIAVVAEKLNEGIAEFNKTGQSHPPYELFQRCHAILAAGTRIRADMKRDGRP